MIINHPYPSVLDNIQISTQTNSPSLAHRVAWRCSWGKGIDPELFWVQSSIQLHFYHFSPLQQPTIHISPHLSSGRIQKSDPTTTMLDGDWIDRDIEVGWHCST